MATKPANSQSMRLTRLTRGLSSVIILPLYPGSQGEGEASRNDVGDCRVMTFGMVHGYWRCHDGWHYVLASGRESVERPESQPDIFPAAGSGRPAAGSGAVSRPPRVWDENLPRQGNRIRPPPAGAH